MKRFSGPWMWYLCGRKILPASAGPKGMRKDFRRIKVISFDEAAELAYFGAKVLHPATVLPAIQQNIPVYVLNSLNPTCEGTKVTARAPRCANIFRGRSSD